MNLSEFVSFRKSLAGQVIGLLVELFQGFQNWGDTEADEFVAQAVPLALGARRTMADLTALWVSDQVNAQLGLTVPPVGVPDDILARPGVSTEDVYRRPFVTVRTKLSQGRTLDQAASAGAARVAQVAEGDLQRAHSEAARSAIEALPVEAKPTGWRRVPTGNSSCPLCVVAASQLYDNGAANPMHPNCDCAVALAYSNDPGEQDTARLNGAIEALTGRVGGMTDGEIRTVLRLMTPNHGELGSMLVRPGDHFTTQGELPS